MKKTIRDVELKNKNVVIRVDFNVPIKNGIIQSNERIVAALETINYAIKSNAKVILLSHLSRIKTEEDKLKKSLFPIAQELSKLLNKKVFFVPETRGEMLKKAVQKLEPGQVMLVENTRFEDLNDKAESKNSPELGQEWAAIADVFINDAFATAHRSHASNVGISTRVPVSAVGLLVEKELNAFDTAFAGDTHPFVAVVGGAKVKDKISYLTKLTQKADKVLIGGAMAYTFLKAKGFEIANSLVEDDQIDFARDLMANCKCEFILPLDNAMVTSFEEGKVSYSKNQNVTKGHMGIDVGPKTIKEYEKHLSNAKLVYWNGPLGVFELPFGEAGTSAIGNAMVNSNAYTIIGGGDTISASEKLGFKDKINHVSTGGGASQQYLLDHELPAINAIQDL
ncbi:phosphoglycerate kinase [Mycoplasma sp. ES3157-GEN-MYC]|uniref:Phosphoglycerate kinase n=1 Tax=Mycoplasma miroungigenitalium TaxID=754515 RepID=A0A6M4JAU7_9MOLU|nr:phosphoglycerate kinase [Mycoplasma miroungigenitalium]MBU4690109.1 phosphoglycerate kinase [Mycoplasma miroungigenitalium]MBU4691381.1 phosphoglycerate kinase [Mycoplasma miroungigenitalium]QJR43217.1 phosphoglycerate kinase [Mycoplasma miroungigenitalium]